MALRTKAMKKTLLVFHVANDRSQTTTTTTTTTGTTAKRDVGHEVKIRKPSSQSEYPLLLGEWT
jgi:hypothetical protein